MTKSTSFRLPSTTLSLLKRLANDDNRSLTNYLEKLITDKAKAEGLTRDAPNEYKLKILDRT